VDALTLKTFIPIVQGLTILEPYIAVLNVNPVPASFDNGAPARSHSVTVGVIMGIDWPTDEETAKLKSLGWVFDDDYVTLYL
jgi:hypothetical protein